AGQGTISGVVTNGSGTQSLEKRNATGTWTISGNANTYTGSTVVTAGTLRVTGSIATSSGVTVNSGGTFDAAASQLVKTLTVGAGGTAVVSSGATPRVLTVGDNVNAAPLNVGTGTSTGRVDLSSNALIVDVPDGSQAATLTTVRSAIVSAYNAGAWDGNGITSSSIATNSSLAVGYALSTDVPSASGGTYLGSNVDTSAVIARTTLSGDADLSDNVDFNDLVKLAQNYNTTDGARNWIDGDFTYDGNVDFNDLVKLAQNYNTALPAPGSIPGASAAFETDLARAFAAVPEPGTLGLFGVVGLAVLGRRRRRDAVAGDSTL
ncbi:MAG TPA: autotransporter-associated beta strand repeat-containing protein, partial [Tepidisphaeraceae bacterium]